MPPELKPSGGRLELFVGPFGVEKSLNPYLVIEDEFFDPAARLFGPAYLAGVAAFNGGTGELEPNLVTALPSTANGGLAMNPDGTLTIRYDIDPNAVWSDGTPVSGDDFAFTYEVVTATIARLEAAAADDASDEEFFTTCGDHEPVGMLPMRIFGADVFSAIDPASVIAGPKTFQYTLTDPGAYNTELFEFIVPRHAVQGTDFLWDWNDRMWPSAGPFVVQSLDTERLEVTMVRNENYWRTDPETGQDLPYLDTLVLTALEDEYLERTEWPEFHRAMNDCRDPFAAAALIGLDFGSDEGQDLFARFDGVYRAIEEALFFEGLATELDMVDVADERVSELQAQGAVVRNVRGPFWEHIAFHFGDARLRANDASLVEHREFRQAVAHGLDRGRLVEAALGFAVDPVGSLVEAFSPSVSGAGWDRYDYNPERSRELLAVLCNRLARDCDADPPRLVFTRTPSDAGGGSRARVGEMMGEMLADVGITVDIVDQDTTDMTFFAGCTGWESSIWTWAGGAGDSYVPVALMFTVFDPAATANPRPEGRLAGFGAEGTNLYAWGTDAVTGAIDLDLPATDSCDETTVYNQGPSSVRDEFTQRFEELLRESEAVVDPFEQLPLVLEMEEILASQAVMIPLYQRPLVRAFRTDIVGGYGYEVDNFGFIRFWNVAEWYLVAD